MSVLVEVQLSYYNLEKNTNTICFSFQETFPFLLSCSSSLSIFYFISSIRPALTIFTHSENSIFRVWLLCEKFFSFLHFVVVWITMHSDLKSLLVFLSSFWRNSVISVMWNECVSGILLKLYWSFLFNFRSTENSSTYE